MQAEGRIQRVRGAVCCSRLAKSPTVVACNMTCKLGATPCLFDCASVHMGRRSLLHPTVHGFCSDRHFHVMCCLAPLYMPRSEERRVGKECRN